MSCVSSVGGLLYVMKWLRPDVSHVNDVVRYVTESGVAVKWVIQRLRSTNATYNGYTEIVCDNCNVYFTGVFDRRYLSLNMSHNTFVENMLEVE